jgi:predicted enzyme related to lactoylglutathione lyase
MSISSKPEIGSITWFDLTVPDADKVKDFYSPYFVGIGWKSTPVSMGDYNDFKINSPDSGKTNASICHNRGGNADLPIQWLIYITVRSADENGKLCEQNGGKVLVDPREIRGYGIEDFTGAVCALFEPA